MSLWQEVSIIYLGTKGILDDVALDQIQAFEKGFHQFLTQKYPDVVNDIEKQKELTDSIVQRLDRAGNEFKMVFLNK